MKGYLCLPMKKNVEEGRENWELTKCKNCGEE